MDCVIAIRVHYDSVERPATRNKNIGLIETATKSELGSSDLKPACRRIRPGIATQSAERWPPPWPRCLRPLPIKPRPSLVVALTPMRCGGICNVSDNLVFIACRCGLTLGASAMSEQSMLTMASCLSGEDRLDSAQNFLAVDPFDRRISVRKMMPDILFSGCTQEGICDSVG